MGLLNALLSARDGGSPQPTPAGQPVPTRVPEINGFIAGFFPVATIFLFLRLYARWRFNYIGKDDMVIIVAYILYIGLIIATVLATKYGLGIHIWDVDYPKTGQQMQKCGLSSQLLYPATLGCIKFSILLFLSRVVPSTSAWKQRIYWIAGFVVCEETAFTLALFFQCRPLEFYWNKDIKGTCFNQPVFYYVDASINICTDLMILSLPWLIFSSLRVPRRKKYALLCICSVGVFTLVASIVRLPYLHDLNVSKDPTWHVTDIAIWTIAELGSAITTASIPTIKPLVSWLFPKFMASTNLSNNALDSRTRTGTGNTGSNTYGLTSVAMGGNPRSKDVKSYIEMGTGRDGITDEERSFNDSEEFIVSDTGRVIPKTV